MHSQRQTPSSDGRWRAPERCGSVTADDEAPIITLSPVSTKPRDEMIRRVRRRGLVEIEKLENSECQRVPTPLMIAV